MSKKSWPILYSNYIKWAVKTSWTYRTVVHQLQVALLLKFPFQSDSPVIQRLPLSRQPSSFSNVSSSTSSESRYSLIDVPFMGWNGYWTFVTRTFVTIIKTLVFLHHHLLHFLRVQVLIDRYPLRALGWNGYWNGFNQDVCDLDVCDNLLGTKTFVPKSFCDHT